MPLHREGKINFLGRYKTKDYDDYYNPFEKIFFMIRNNLLEKNELSICKDILNNVLSKDKLNVISEESISLTHKKGI